MIGGDFETVRGEWGVRGEVAAFVATLSGLPAPLAEGSSVDAGVGVDRRAGDYRISGTVLFHHESSGAPLRLTRRRVLVLVGRSSIFARERYAVRAFGVANTSEGSGFARASRPASFATISRWKDRSAGSSATGAI